MRAKYEIFTVSPKTFRAKVQTSYDKEEKTSQHALYGPHLLIKEDIPGKCSCRKKTVTTEGHRMTVLTTLLGWLVQRTVNQSSARKKLRLIYSPEMLAVWVIQNQGFDSFISGWRNMEQEVWIKILSIQISRWFTLNENFTVWVPI